MDVTTMPLTSLLTRLSADFPAIQFTAGEQFSWSPEKRTIFYELSGDPALLIHELGHALLDHEAYTRDVQLLTLERAAWDEAKKLAPTYDITISDDTVEDALDTYRDWLHARSTCPHCGATGFQSGIATYACPACTREWVVNEARVCQLRRTKNTPA